jgi:hypothetical protein
VAVCYSTFIIFNIHSYNTILHSFILHHLPRPVFFWYFIAQQEKPPGVLTSRESNWREPTELRRTLLVKCPPLGVRAAARAAVCGEQGLLRDRGGEPTELRRTLKIKCPYLGVRAVARAAVCGEQGLLRDGGGESSRESNSGLPSASRRTTN